ncbi:hypothetical protein N9Z64_00570 [bacterium]|nr:hypothetical protein [bacterium]
MVDGVVEYFSDNTTTVLGPAILQVEMFNNYGRSDEKKENLDRASARKQRPRADRQGHFLSFAAHRLDISI